MRHGGREEYDAVAKIYDNPKTPAQKIAAMTALGATEVPELMHQTLASIGTKCRDQDIMYFFRGLASNFKTRRLLSKYFQDEYDTVSGFGSCCMR